MDQATLKRLSQNPHYKLSAKQRAQLAEEERDPMVTFGEVPRQFGEVPLHKTSPERKVKRQ